MNITVYRGGHQIGGCITEIATDHCRIIIDLGSNLPGSQTKELTAEDVEKITNNADAIFYTHYHGDHVGLFHLVPSSVPQYIGCGAKEVMHCKFKTLKMKECVAAIAQMRTYQDNQCIDVSNKGEIFITPYFVSHSAFDAHLFKIVCEGKNIVHMGDFRQHGFLGKGLLPTLRQWMGKVDILITEGTMLGRQQEKVLHENDIKNNTAKLLKEHKYVFALCSSTDMERLAGFHAACLSTDRVFLADKYQKQVLKIFSKYAGPHSPLFRFNKVFALINFSTRNVKEYLQQRGFLLPIRASQIKLVEAMMKEYSDEPAWLIYSMWNGYAEKDKPYTNPAIRTLRKLFGERIKDGTKDDFHTSGHADTDTLKTVCEKLHPRLGIITIHKDKDTNLCTLPGMEQYRVFPEGNHTIENINISIQ